MRNSFLKTGSMKNIRLSSNSASPTSPQKRGSTFKSLSPAKRESFSHAISPLQNEMVLSRDLLEMAEIKEVQENRERIVREQNKLAEVTAILNKAPEERSQADLNHLAHLVVEVAFFKNLEATRGRDRLLKCLSRLTYSKTATNHAVFYQGEIGTEFYIILKGKVKVSKASWVNLTETEEKKQTQKPPEKPKETQDLDKEEEIVMTRNELKDGFTSILELCFNFFR